ncbi:MAG: folylpolyglutamate synthase/dihydrofolate synthase family protein [Alphaproteobacteria bacterium]
MTERPSDALLDRLSRLHPKIIDLSLDRIERLLGRLGNPERHLPPVVHVAGTNGKGSVVAFLRAIAEAAGYRAHVYISPHLVRFHERIRLAGTLIDEAALAAILEECEAANGGAPITFFEVTTAAAFLAFARTSADIVILEVGLGGRLDATNVIERPLLSAITPVAIDHTQYLGETLAAIAGEKAGILKRGAGAVIGIQDASAARIIGERASDLGCPIFRAGVEWDRERRGAGMVYRSATHNLAVAEIALPGLHQIDNAAMAIACAEHLDGFRIDESAIRTGIAKAVWPARLQRLAGGRLATILPTGWELWLDGAHNPAAGAALAAQAAGWRDRPLHLVVGMLATKDAQRFLEPLAPFTRSLVAVPVPGHAAALPAADVEKLARGLGIQATSAADTGAALYAITAKSPRPGRILVCGSLYLAGTVLAANGTVVS